MSTLIINKLVKSLPHDVEYKNSGIKVRTEKTLINGMNS